MTESIELKQVYLGFKPFILIEIAMDDDDNIDISLRAGGGMQTDQATIVATLKDVVNILDEGAFEITAGGWGGSDDNPRDDAA